jgi:predicted nucleotidyltransferase
MAHPWEHALDRFLLGWKVRAYVKGAVVCGSRVAGTATKFSDIDVHIVMDDRVRWRERGLKIVDGYLEHIS